MHFVPAAVCRDLLGGTTGRRAEPGRPGSQDLQGVGDKSKAIAVIAKQKPRGDVPAGFLINLAIPTFASALTIIGPGCLTTVFGMGTGVSTTVWSPEKRATGGKTRAC